MTQHFLEIENLAKIFPPAAKDASPLTVFNKVNFSIEKGEFVCIIGHSGCGKSTILNILAGLDSASEGAVIMDGKEVAGPSLDRGVIFQNYSLLPWKSALNNILFAVKARWPQWSKHQCREHALKYLDMVGLAEAKFKKPSQLSGGMRQRVSIARAFAIEPKLLLMDEPFGALDALTRGIIQEELIKIWEQTNQTVFMITHDIDEAILLADRVLLMTNGPYAKVAESVAIDIPRHRERTEIIHHPNYYPIRNHLIEFLVTRSHELANPKNTDLEQQPDEPGFPKMVNPALTKDRSQSADEATQKDLEGNVYRL